MRRRANYTWQNYKTNEGIVSELKINPGVQKIQNHVNKWIQNVQRMDRERDCHNYEMSTMCETKPRTTLKRLLDC